jgi:hypothetical protein
MGLAKTGTMFVLAAMAGAVLTEAGKDTWGFAKEFAKPFWQSKAADVAAADATRPGYDVFDYTPVPEKPAIKKNKRIETTKGSWTSSGFGDSGPPSYDFYPYKSRRSGKSHGGWDTTGYTDYAPVSLDYFVPNKRC